MLIGVAVISTCVAAVASVVAWRVVRDERRRSAARVETLAREIHNRQGFDLELRNGHERSAEAFAVQPQKRSAEAFALQPQKRSAEAFALASDRSAERVAVQPRPRLGLALAVAAFLAASVGAAAIVFGGGPSSASQTSTSGGAAKLNGGNAEGRDAPAPLELVALAHEREGDTLTVRGTIRNPVSGLEMDHLTAVVFVFDSRGGFLSSGRAAVESAALIPGGESTFAVTIPGAEEVARYRVSFRSGDRIVAHVDKRNGS